MKTFENAELEVIVFDNGIIGFETSCPSFGITCIIGDGV